MSGSEIPIRTLFASTSYPRDAADWRGIFMAHISASLARNHAVRLSQWTPPGEVGAHVQWVTTPAEAAWLAKLMRRGGISHVLRKHPLAGVLSAAKLLWLLRSVYRREVDVDLYHVNWLQCALPLPANGKPALITVLGNDMHLLKLPMMRAMLRRVMRGRKVVICPNASWMEAPLNEAFGDCATILPVPFGIDARWYAIERNFGHLHTPPRWLAVTRLTANKLGPLLQWSEPLFGNGQRELHLFGPMQEDIDIPDWVHYHGPATPDQLANDWFPGACGLITLSRHAEGRPQVMLEAMAAALPIVASRMPAHADIVADGTTGALCDSRDDYAKALVALEVLEVNRHMGEAARAWVAQGVGTWGDCAERYVDVYRNLQECSAHG